MKTFEKLKKKILKDTGLQLEAFERSYPGRHQRDAGAFRWSAKITRGGEIVGSEWTAGALMKAEKITISRTPPGFLHVYPD